MAVHVQEPQYALDLNLSASDIPGHSLAYPDGFLAHFDALRTQFVDQHHLQPVRLVLTGPPCSGKSALAHHLARQYGLRVLDKATLLTAAVDLPDIAAAATKSPSSLTSAQWAQLCRHVIDSSSSMRNRGVILDGYPKTLLEARELFTDAREWTEAEVRSHGELAAMMDEEAAAAAPAKGDKGKKKPDAKAATPAARAIDDVADPRAVLPHLMPGMLVRHLYTHLLLQWPRSQWPGVYCKSMVACRSCWTHQTTS